MFDKPADKSRLRRTDIWGGPDRLFDDERRTLDEAKVLPGDLLWLEDGKVPRAPRFLLEPNLCLTRVLCRVVS